jgi:4-amino-4-deoxy-L-arabinose transferase-like glycosyltransferase
MKRNLLIFFVFLVLGMFLRGCLFQRSVFGHDESTYILIAQAILDGEELYIDRVDTKPPGIFLLFSLFLGMFKEGIFGVRLFTALFISVTSFFIFIVSHRLWRDDFIAFLSGLLYLFLCSVSPFAFGANTEMFFLFFVAAGVAIIYKHQENTPRYFFFGILLGAAVIIKQVVLLEVLFFGVIVFLYALFKKASCKTLFSRMFLYLLGVAVPCFLISMSFVLRGHVSELFEFMILVPRRYSSPINSIQMLLFVLNFHTYYFFVLIPFYGVIIYELGIKKQKERYWPLFVGFFWFGVIAAAIIIPGKFFGHYYIQLFVVLSIIAPGFILSWQPLYLFLRKRQTLVVVLVVCTLFSVVFSSQYKYCSRMDIPRVIVEDIRPLMSSDDEIFVGRKYHILYYLLDRLPPTKYVHPTILSDARLAQVIGYDRNKELKRILDLNPRFIITRGEYPLPWMEKRIQNRYRLMRWYDNSARVMILKDPVNVDNVES